MTSQTTSALEALTVQVAALETALTRLDASSRTFAQSLIQQFRRRGSLSVRQVPHVAALVERANRAAAAAPTEQPRGTQVDAEGFEILRSLLQTAADRGMRPRVTVPLNGATYRIAPPAARSTYAGRPVLFVRRDSEYMGRIEAGRFMLSHMGNVPEATIVRDLGMLLSAPVGMMQAIGQRTGVCCFCARELTDERSIQVGYGPVCAEHYGLPWGEQSPSVPVLGAGTRGAMARADAVRPSIAECVRAGGTGRCADLRAGRAGPTGRRGPRIYGRRE